MSGQLAEQALGHAMDGIALNGAQQLLLRNPSPAVDSLDEVVPTLAAYGVPAEVIATLSGISSRLYEANGGELACERGAAGAIERHLRWLRDLAMSRSKGVKPLAKAVRRLLRDAHSLDDEVAARARAALRVLCDGRDTQLSSASFEHELRPSRMAQLRRIIGDEGE